MEALLLHVQEADKSIGTGIKVVDIYQRDDEVKNCPICEEKFTAIFRRHHCRQCRRVICGNCTKHKRKLPSQHDGERKKRVCDECLLKPANWRPENQRESEIKEDTSSDDAPTRPVLPDDIPNLSESSCIYEDNVSS